MNKVISVLNFVGDVGLPNMFVSRSAFDILDWKIDSGTGYVTDWKSKDLPESRHFY